MDSLTTLFSKSQYLRNAEVKQVLKSKKHRVYLINIDKKEMVLKWYQQGYQRNMIKECEILTEKSTPYPKPFVIRKNEKEGFLLMSYINGENICDLINNPRFCFHRKILLIQHLSHWFTQFHDYHQSKKETLVHGDAHLRNFIATPKGIIYGLDFEETFRGDFMIDIADFCASILTTNPMFTEEKHKLVDTFIQHYGELTSYKLKDIEKKINQSVQKTEERRKK